MTIDENKDLFRHLMRQLATDDDFRRAFRNVCSPQNGTLVGVTPDMDKDEFDSTYSTRNINDLQVLMYERDDDGLKIMGLVKDVSSMPPERVFKDQDCMPIA